jgi:hypothetical protein
MCHYLTSRKIQWATSPKPVLLSNVCATTVVSLVTNRPPARRPELSPRSSVIRVEELDTFRQIVLA